MVRSKKMSVLMTYALGACLGFSATAQDFKCTTWDAYPQGVQKARELHVIYRDALKSKNYKDAFSNWEAVFAHVTVPTEAPERHFDDGITLYVEMAKAETDAAKKKEYIQKINTLYEHKFKCLGEKPNDRAMQGYNMYVLQADVNETIKVYERCLELGKNETPYYALTPAASLAVFMFRKSDKFNADYMVNLYNQIKGICDENIKANKNAAKFQETWAQIDGIFKPIEGYIFGCEYYENKLRPDFEKAGDDFEKVKAIRTQLASKCTASSVLFQQADAKYLALKAKKDSIEFDSLIKDDNTPHFTKYQLLEKRGQKAEAYKWLEKAFDNPKATISFPAEVTDVEKGTSAYRIAYSYYEKNSYSTARSWCRKASDIRPNWGEPYILVGLMYASSGRLCGPGTGWDSQVVVWAAMDEWSKARSVDANAADEANKYIGKYREFLPSVGEGFQRNIKEGDSYKVGCWIQTSTSARFKK